LRSKLIFGKFSFAIVITGIFFLLKSLWLDPSALAVKHTNIKLTSWPKNCSGLKIVILADLHVGSPYINIEKLEQVVKKTINIDPDLILLAGDYVVHGIIGGETVEPAPIANILKKLQSKADVYAVLGNHDNWFKDVTEAFASAGIPILNDRSVEIEKGQCRFWLAGITDFTSAKHDIAKALTKIPKKDPIVVLTHDPDIFYDLPERVSITFSGHTHGGQVSLPFVGTPVVPSRYGDKFSSGLIQEKGKSIFVSPGIGTSIVPVRFGVIPEISVVTLSSK